MRSVEAGRAGDLQAQAVAPQVRVQTLAPAAEAVVAGSFFCLPTCTANDGRFLALAPNGPGLDTLSDADLDFELAVDASTTSFALGFFDGDSGGTHWDLGSGVLEMHPNGYGFLRNPDNNYQRERTDPFVPGTMINKYSLREGVLLNGMVQHSRKQQGPRLKEIQDVDGMPPEEYVNVKSFDALTPINPESWLQLETGPEPLSPWRPRPGPTSGAPRRLKARCWVRVGVLILSKVRSPMVMVLRVRVPRCSSRPRKLRTTFSNRCRLVQSGSPANRAAKSRANQR